MNQHQATLVAYTKQLQLTNSNKSSGNNFNSSAAPSQVGATRASKQQAYAMAVRVPAKVAPQIVSAVPGCRRQQSKWQRTHSLDSVAFNHCHLPHDLDQPLQLVMRNNSSNIKTNDKNNNNTSIGSNQQHQLLLIVDQEHQMSQPVVGRRVPEKSMGSHEHQNLLTTIAQCNQQVALPVTGRRAHRQQQRLILDPKLIGSSINLELSKINKSKLQLNGVKQMGKLEPSTATTTVLCNDPNCQAVTCYCCCCLAAAAEASQKATKRETAITSPCQAACCMQTPVGSNVQLIQQNHNSQIDPRKLTRTSKHQIHQHQHNHASSCSANKPNHGLIMLKAPNHHHNHYYKSSQLDAHMSQQLTSKQIFTSRHQNELHQHYHMPSTALSCSSNSSSLNTPPPVPLVKPQLRLLTTAMTAHEHWSEMPQPGHFRLLRDSALDERVTNNNNNSNLEEYHKPSVYDSLAAELKAKLGDPKLGPILLPPKDYDTLSRQQGRLTGIEKRRSTNPLLVRQNKTWQLSINEDTETSKQNLSPTKSESVDTKHNKNIVDDDDRQQKMLAAASPTSGQQRSRSNSSSGLGSISVGLQSQCSRSPSQSSSSEDVIVINSRQRDHHPTVTSDSKLTNCGQAASDSGHSGSGRLQSASSSASSSSVISSQHRFNSSSSNSSSASSSSAAASIIREKTLNETRSRNIHNNCTNDCPNLIVGRGRGIQNHNPSKVSSGALWNGRVEVPLKINSDRNGSQTYLATKQIIY